MLTIFSIPKAFHGHIDVIQRNAIQSWLRLYPPCEVILCGDDAGVAEVASEFGVRHLPDITRNEYGTPLLSSAFARIQQVAQHRLICYVNADIIFLSHLTACIKRVAFQRFLMVGQRWDLVLTAPLDFQRQDWEQRLMAQVSNHGILHPPSGSDYFVFPTDVMGHLPDFAVGRPGWDNWFIYRARTLGIPVIDVTDVNTVIHQNHDYSHIPHGSDGKSSEGPEADYNLNLVGGFDHVFTLEDATHLMTRHMLLPAWKPSHLRRVWRTLPILRPETRTFVRFVDRLIQKAGS